MKNSPENISISVKVLGMVNLGSVLFVWLPLAPGDNGIGFSTLDNLFSSVFFLWLLFCLQGVLVFLKRLRKWDLLLASMIVVSSLLFCNIFEEPRFLIAGIPMALYLVLQVKREIFSQNIKLAYLNIWNILILALVVFELRK